MPIKGFIEFNFLLIRYNGLNYVIIKENIAYDIRKLCKKETIYPANNFIIFIF